VPFERPRHLQLFTHDDLDGVGCGIIFKAKFGIDAPVSYCSYSTFNSRIIDYITAMNAKGRTGFLMITDASLAPQTAIAIDGYVERGGQVALLDHHANGAPWEGTPYLEWMRAKPWAHVDSHHCAALLAALTVVDVDRLAVAELGRDRLAPIRRNLRAVEKDAELVSELALVVNEHAQDMHRRHRPAYRIGRKCSISYGVTWTR